MDITPQLSSYTPEIIPPPAINVMKKNEVSIFNKEAFLKSTQIKSDKIKDILVKSLKNNDPVQNIKRAEINLKSPEDLVKYFKIYDNNILFYRKKEISSYAGIGMIINSIKLIFPTNWYDFLKEHKIHYSKDYLIFLVSLFKLFEKHKTLYKSVLSLSFFRKNFSIIKSIIKNGGI